MTQIHCEIKTHINNEFDKLEVTKHVVEKEHIEEINENQSFASNTNQNQNQKVVQQNEPIPA